MHKNLFIATLPWNEIHKNISSRSFQYSDRTVASSETNDTPTERSDTQLFEAFVFLNVIPIFFWNEIHTNIRKVPRPIVVIMFGRLTIEILFLLPFFKKLIGIITRCVIMCVFVLVFA